MRVTKQQQSDFNYLNTIQKINKMQGSPRFLSKENLQLNKNPHIIHLPKNSILNNIPIKVRLIRAAQINPNINLSKIHNINKNSKTSKNEIQINDDSKSIKKIDKNNANNKSLNINSSKEDESKINELNNKDKINKNDRNILSPKSRLCYNKSHIYKLKNFLNSPKSGEKESESTLNTNNIKTNKFTPDNPLEKEDNYDINTFNQNDNKVKKNIFPQNFAYNKPKKDNLGVPYSIMTQKGYLSNSLNLTEANEAKEYDNNSYVLLNYDNSSVCSTSTKKTNINISPNLSKKKDNNKKIINNNSSCNILTGNIKRIKISRKKDNKNYDLNTYIQNNQNEFISSRLIASPFKDRNNSISNNNSFNLNNNYNYNINVLSLSPKKKNINPNLNYDNIDIKLDDLILFEERLSDILIALSTNKNIYDGGASNECIEFFAFYFHSSLKQIFPYFFNGMNKVIIKSAMNLKLFTIVIAYHLSLNPSILSKLINELKNIFTLSKMNLYLFIKKIQLFYGENYTKQNEMYFKTFNYILSKKGLFNCNEEEIVTIINKNCYEIVNNLNSILNYYKSIENNYYLDFLEIFISISKITEKDINNYFYNHLYENSVKGNPQPKYINSTKKNIQFNGFGVITDNNIKINSKKNSQRVGSPNKIIKNSGKLLNKLINKEEENLIILEYQKNKISPPFIKTPNEKKYSVVLDLDETLININQNGVCNLRPGLFSFLNAIKPYYEIISFTNGAKSYSDSIIKQIEARNHYFDFNLYREHSLLCGRDFIKDISRIGRDMKKMIIVDNIANNFKLNSENGIQIAPYFGEYSKNDTVLFELKKLLIMFYKIGYEDLRVAIKDYSQEIKNNITREKEE